MEAVAQLLSTVMDGPETTSDSLGSKAAIERIISLIDLTDLDDARRADGIAELLAAASTHRTAAVCVWPDFVARASSELAGSGVRIATVANFPEGTGSPSDVVVEVAASLATGADEIDVVLPWRRFLEGDVDHARAVLLAAAEQVRAVPGALLKVILETGRLADTATIEAASHLAIECGAHFLKTSTGKTGVGATPDAVAAMVDVIARHGAHVGIKPSGGIKTVADANALLGIAAERLGDEWATPRTFRFGASSLLDEALTALGSDPAN